MTFDVYTWMCLYLIVFLKLDFVVFELIGIHLIAALLSTFTNVNFGKGATIEWIHYESMPIQIYWKIYHQKMKIFR